MLPKNRPPTHPGEMLLKEFLEPLSVSQSEFARHLGWTFARLNEIVNGRRRVTADSALALGEALGTGPELWLNLQRDWDLWHSLRHRSPVPLLQELAAAHHPSAQVQKSGLRTQYPRAKRFTAGTRTKPNS